MHAIGSERLRVRRTHTRTSSQPHVAAGVNLSCMQEIYFCYYCDRLFDNEANLVVHQKNKHYK